MIAEGSQELEFPRGADTEVPEAIRRACYEIAHTLLDGKDPELELENLGIVSQGYRQFARLSAALMFPSNTSSTVCLPRWHGDCLFRSCETMTQFA